MISLTREQLEKIQILDTFLSAVTLDDLKKMAETDMVVAKLRGVDQNTNILDKLIQEHNSMNTDIMYLSTQMAMMKNDFQTLLRALNQTLFTPQYNSDFSTLINKHSAY